MKWSRREFAALAAAPLLARSRRAEAGAPQGFSPMAFAITADGAYAYIGFDLCERVLRVRMEDLSVEGVAELSQFFPMESECLVLDESAGKLFVFDTCRLRVVVVRTETMAVVDIIPDAGSNSMFLSRWGPTVLAPFNQTVTSIDTETHKVSRFTDKRTGFLRIRESAAGRDLWHVATQDGPHGPWVVGLYDWTKKEWQKRFLSTPADYWEGVHDFLVLPDESCAYLATFGGWYPGYHGYGWLHRVDLETGSANVSYVDGGALCLESDDAGGRVFVGCGWPEGGQNNILSFDTKTGEPAGQATLARTKYGWQSTQMNRLRRHPAWPGIIHGTTSDANAFLAVDTASMTLTRSLVLNREDNSPFHFARRPGTTSAYVLLLRSPYAVEMNLDTAEVSGVVRMPVYRTDARSFDIGFPGDGRLLAAQGESVVEADAGSLREVARYALPRNAPGLWSFSLSREGKRLYSVSYERGISNPAANFLSVYATAGFAPLAGLRLEGGNFASRPWEAPDGTKLFVAGGMPNGAVVVHIIETTSFSLSKTISFEERDLNGISAGPSAPYAYDELRRILFVGATNVVLAIDIDRESIVEVIPLAQAAPANGLEPWQLTYCNAVGLVHQAATNRLYIAHVDRSFVSVYDLNTGRFLPQLIPLGGYFPSAMFDSGDQTKLYTLNGRSSDVSVIDTATGTLSNLIDLASLGVGGY